MDLERKPVRMVSLYNIIVICLFIYMLVMIVGRRVSATKSGIAGGSEATGNLGADQSVAQTGRLQTANLVSTRLTSDNEDSDSSELSCSDVSEDENQHVGE